MPELQVNKLVGIVLCEATNFTFAERVSPIFLVVES